MSLRDLTIKTNTLKRVLNDEQYYLKEAASQRTHIDKLRADGADEYVIRKQVEVLDETLNMLPDSKKRIAKAVEDLKTLMDTHPTTFKGSQELKKAQDVLGSINYDA
ncbi:hypothetical protein H4R33_004741 [Dimargaris cristalligena]|uniref:Tubulin-specific chaperone A n=1 Tax=Dimargaris cristalligena TaxID=215637 RepID=A0A4P9ZU99_9FUNG|nr:hypothetical protein H4R33_004741 [Dimargaris cristalligena]RKP37115.1 tubulin binding cofactor A [Dimargaris cristalligena]|eukprot:RKP37115.1 tubulin binding cofactor A [Dimargaris cristalligena]